MLDSHELKNGRIQSAKVALFRDYSYIFNFGIDPYLISGKGAPTLVTYANARKEASRSRAYSEAKGIVYQGFSYGFQDRSSDITLSLPIALDPMKGERLSNSWKNVFYAEYYFVSFSVEATARVLPTALGKSFVSTIYYGSYARMVLTTNRDRSDVVKAFAERLSQGRSKMWDEVLGGGELFLSLSHVPIVGSAVNSDQFFALISGQVQEPKGILFSVRALD